MICFNATISIMLAFPIVMSADVRIRTKLQELAEALRRLAEHAPGKDGVELERCACEVHPDSIVPPAPRPTSPPRMH